MIIPEDAAMREVVMDFYKWNARSNKYNVAFIPWALNGTSLGLSVPANSTLTLPRLLIAEAVPVWEGTMVAREIPISIPAGLTINSRSYVASGRTVSVIMQLKNSTNAAIVPNMSILTLYYTANQARLYE